MGDINRIIEYAENMLTANLIPHTVLEPPYEKCEYIDLGLRNQLFQLKSWPEPLIKYLMKREEGILYFTTDVFKCSYATLRVPDSDKILICGPVIYEKLSTHTFEHLFERLEMDEKYRDILFFYYSKIPFFDTSGTMETIMIELGKMLYGHKFEYVYEDAAALVDYRRVYQTTFRAQEKPFSNMEFIEQRYAMENELLNAITKGNEKQALEWLDRMKKASVSGLRQMEDEFRNIKDYLLTLNTLCRKSVEKVGVHPIFIDAISNEVVLQIENSTTDAECEKIMVGIIKGYTLLVREMNHHNYSPTVQKIIAYINLDLREDLSLKNFSNHFNMNASYLSTLFSKEVGMSLSEYVNLRRVDHAKKLLQSSELPIKIIAEYCGFQDTHYFCRVFKKIAGVTPKFYRDSEALNWKPNR